MPNQIAPSKGNIVNIPVAGFQEEEPYKLYAFIK